MTPRQIRLLFRCLYALLQYVRYGQFPSVMADDLQAELLKETSAAAARAGVKI